MDFYTSVLQKSNKIYVRGYRDGKRVTEIEHYNPYLFVSNKNGKYKTLNGLPVEKKVFESISKAKEFIEEYQQLSNFNVYGSTIFPYVYIFDYFKGQIDYDISLINIGIIDIEVAADEGFPDIQLADKEITAITVRTKGKSIIFGCGEFKTTDPDIVYVRCADEKHLLEKFLAVWQKLDFDIVTGWNIEFFDIPYISNRIVKLFSEFELKKLSPWGIVESRLINRSSMTEQAYKIYGLEVLDYLQLYKKFTFSNKESYKLDYIANLEVDAQKIDYSEYGDLLELYKNDYQKFIEYNNHDCVLVEKLENKLKFIEQVIAFAYDAKVNYIDTMTTVRSWDVIIHNYLLEKGIVVPQAEKSSFDENLVGGYVKTPKNGMSEWVVSFDLNSLYPHLIMQYNISPETFVRRLKNPPTIEQLLSGDYDFSEIDPNNEYSMAANGCQYTKKFKGFLPEIMEKMYDDRTIYKKKMLEAQQQYENTKDPKYKNLIAQYHNMQLAKKIQLNSAYGALANVYFRWFNFNHAEAITMSGQLSIRWIEKKINEYMNKLLKTKNKDYVIASDTDSVYIEMADLVNKVFPNQDDKVKIVNTLDKFIKENVEVYIDACYKELASYINSYQQKMFMKRETIADKGIWRGKKMYILNALNVEGVQYEKPKIKMSGIEAVRSSTPHACRESIKEAFYITLNGTKDDLLDYIEKFKYSFMNELPFEDISFPRGVKNLEKYSDEKSIYIKGSPIHVKGALIFNHMLKQKGITTIPPIKNGDKIKFAYLKQPNPTGDTVIATPDILPKQFGMEEYIDKEMQFSKSFLEPVKSITSVIGWDTEKRSTLEDFFA